MFIFVFVKTGGNGKAPIPAEISPRPWIHRSSYRHVVAESSRQRGRVELPLNIRDNSLVAMVANEDLQLSPAVSLDLEETDVSTKYPFSND